MDNTIIVAIIAAFTALITVCFTTVLGFLTWSRNLKFQILREERERLEKKYEIALELLSNGLSDSSIDGRLAAMCLNEFPKNVRESFFHLVENDIFSINDPLELKKAYFSIAHEMSVSISDYNTKIQETSEVVDKEFAKKLALDLLESGLLRW